MAALSTFLYLPFGLDFSSASLQPVREAVVSILLALCLTACTCDLFENRQHKTQKDKLQKSSNDNQLKKIQKKLKKNVDAMILYAHSNIVCVFVFAVVYQCAWARQQHARGKKEEMKWQQNGQSPLLESCCCHVCCRDCHGDIGMPGCYRTFPWRWFLCVSCCWHCIVPEHHNTGISLVLIGASLELCF